MIHDQMKAYVAEIAPRLEYIRGPFIPDGTPEYEGYRCLEAHKELVWPLNTEEYMAHYSVLTLLDWYFEEYPEEKK